jgi:hypothetical protein
MGITYRKWRKYSRNVEGVHNIEDGYGYNIYHDDGDNKNLDNSSQHHQSSNASNVSSLNDGDDHNKDDLINSPLPQRGSPEPSTREEWQKFKDVVFP